MPEEADSDVNSARECLTQSRRVAGLKGRLTKTINSLRVSISGENDEDILRKCFAETESAKTAVIEAIYDLCELLLRTGRKEEVPKKEAEVHEIEERVQRECDNLEQHLSCLKLVRSKPAVNYEQNLERLPLASFSGKENYFHWRAVFDVCVHKRNFDDEMKMLRLLSCIHGEAKQLLSPYAPTAEAYEAALARLDSEYGGDRRLLRQTINEVRDGKIIHGDNLKDVREFLSIVESAIINMTNQSLVGELEGGTLYLCAKERLDKTFLRRFLRWASDGHLNDNFETLRTFLQQEVEILREVNVTFEPAPIRKAPEQKSKRVFSSIANEPSAAKKMTEKEKPNFLLHGGNVRHYLDECSMFKARSIDERHEVCKSENLCWLCLKGRHRARQCRSRANRLCSISGCTVLHHPLLHKEREEVSSASQEENHGESRSLTTLGTFERQHTCTRGHTEVQTSLQTVPAFVCHGGKKVLVNVFLDGGSNTSFINENIIDFLGVERGTPMKKEVHTLNGKRQVISTCQVNVTLQSTTHDFKQNVSLLTSSNVTGETSACNWRKVKDNWSHLRDIDFPRLAASPRHDVLIGTDLAYLMSSVKEVPGGMDAPVGRLTPLGWTAMGITQVNGQNENEVNSYHAASDRLTIESETHALVEAFWNLDAIGMTNSQKTVSKLTIEKEIALKQLQEETKTGKANPADLATRGISLQNLKDDLTWTNGPHFLSKAEEDWPKQKQDKEPSLEATKESASSHTTLVVEDNFPLFPSRWSDLHRLRRRMAFVKRFINNCRVSHHERNKSKEPTNEELSKAEILLIQLGQQNAFSQEIKCLTAGKDIPPTSPLVKLNPFLDDEKILRSGSRLACIEWLPYDERYPIILPRNADITRLFIKESHERVGHTVGVNATICEISRKFWIPHVREAVRSWVWRCSLCIKRRSHPPSPQMAPIPSFRLCHPHHAFSKIGLDFAGPFLTKAGRGKPRFKRYVCIFTCLQIRAVHLEFTYSLDTDSFLSALSRMTDRRGVPHEIVSDNGASFVRGELELRRVIQAIDKEKICAETSYGFNGSQGIHWHFNPPAAPNFGGIFERMVRSAKRALKIILEDASINDEELMTALTGVENLLNSRPLTPPSSDGKDATVLTPNHFLIGKIPHQLVSEDSWETVHPSIRWRNVQRLIRGFWQRWQRELLPLLQSRQKWTGRSLNIA